MVLWDFSLLVYSSRKWGLNHGLGPLTQAVSLPTFRPWVRRYFLRTHYDIKALKISVIGKSLSVCATSLKKILIVFVQNRLIFIL